MRPPTFERTAPCRCRAVEVAADPIAAAGEHACPTAPAGLAALLARIATEVDHLRVIGLRPREDLQADSRALQSGRTSLAKAIDATIEAAQHVITASGMRSPCDDADTFRVLAEAGVLPADLARRLHQTVIFRTLLQRGDVEVDDVRVVRIVRTWAGLGDLEAVRAALSRVVAASPARAQRS